MKKIAFCLLACWATFQIKAAEDLWMIDLPKAQAKAKAEKKLVLMDFTGSDWCPPCKALKKNVLSSPEFEKFAKDNLVLVEVDFPRSKPQTEELKKANEKLSQKFKVEGYPTVIMLDGDGKQLSKDVGYGGEKPGEFIAKLEKLKNKS
jgi:protein disulfide-isomerase